MNYKIKQSLQEITPFGGLNLIFSLFKQKNIAQLIDNHLGARNYRAKYAYSDIILALFNNSLCNGDFVSDLQHLKSRVLGDLKPFIPSHDTVEYASQELKVANEIILTNKNIEHQINRNEKINTLLPKICVELEMLKPEVKDYVLDFDNVVLPHQKQDAKKTYKKENGYHPNFANIDNFTVHFENRNGNTPAKYGQVESIETCLNNLNDNKIAINKFRGDSASYQKEVISLLEKNEINFYIRNIYSQGFREACFKTKEWEKVEVGFETKEVSSVYYRPFNGEKTYRVVVTRSLAEEGKNTLFEEYFYNYYGIITNDLEMSNLDVILFYNQRGGDSEGNNKNLLNDFNIKHLPFMDLDTNSVYIGLMAICSNLFEWLKIILVKNKVRGIELQHRTKRVFMRYVCVCAKWVQHARDTILTVFSTEKYAHLQI